MHDDKYKIPIREWIEKKIGASPHTGSWVPGPGSETQDPGPGTQDPISVPKVDKSF